MVCSLLFYSLKVHTSVGVLINVRSHTHPPSPIIIVVAVACSCLFLSRNNKESKTFIPNLEIEFLWTCLFTGSVHIIADVHKEEAMHFFAETSCRCSLWWFYFILFSQISFAQQNFPYFANVNEWSLPVREMAELRPRSNTHTQPVAMDNLLLSLGERLQPEEFHKWWYQQVVVIVVRRMVFHYTN